MPGRPIPRTALLLLAGLAAACGGGADPGGSPAPPTVVVSTSMLGEAVRAIPALQGGVRIVELVPPGSCPGHFDLRPEQAAQLGEASAVLYPEFQEELGRRLGAMEGLRERLVRVPVPSSPLVPEAFLRTVEFVAGELERLEPRWRGRLAASLEPTRRRLRTLALRLREGAAPLAGTPVAASRFQAEFCRWLGLEVVAELPRNGDAAPGALAAALDPRARLVVANLQEGTAAAGAVGERLGIPVAVLSAFPGAPGAGSGYEELLLDNLEALEEAWRRSASPSGR